MVSLWSFGILGFVLRLAALKGNVIVQERGVGFLYETMGKALFEESKVELIIETNLGDFEEKWEEFNHTIVEIKNTCDFLRLIDCTEIYAGLKEELEMLLFEWQLVNGLKRDKKDVVNYLLHFVGLERYDPLLTFNMKTLLDNEKDVGRAVDQIESNVRTFVSQTNVHFEKVSEGLKGVRSLVTKINKAGYDLTQDMKVGFHMDLIIFELRDQFRIMRQRLEILTERGEEKISKEKLGLMLRNMTMFDNFVASLGKYKEYSLETMIKTVEFRGELLSTKIEAIRFGEKEADLIKITPIPEIKLGVIRFPHSDMNFVAIEIGTRQVIQFEDRSNPCNKIRDCFSCPIGLKEKLSTESDCAIRNIFDTVTCEFWDLGGTDVLYKKVLDNKFIFARLEKTLVTVDCEGNKSELQIEGAGILSVQQGCTLMDGSITLRTSKKREFPVLVHLKQIESHEGSTQVLQSNKRGLLVEENNSVKDLILTPIQISTTDAKLKLKDLAEEYKYEGISLATLLCLFIFFRCGGLKLIGFILSKFRVTKSWNPEKKPKEEGQLETVSVKTEDSGKVKAVQPERVILKTEESLGVGKKLKQVLKKSKLEESVEKKTTETQEIGED